MRGGTASPTTSWAMISIFVGGLVIAGAFTFMPGRIMHAVVIGN